MTDPSATHCAESRHGSTALNEVEKIVRLAVQAARDPENRTTSEDELVLLAMARLVPAWRVA